MACVKHNIEHQEHADIPEPIQNYPKTSLKNPLNNQHQTMERFGTSQNDPQRNNFRDTYQTTNHATN
jgi:hypothetical protein